MCTVVRYVLCCFIAVCLISPIGVAAQSLARLGEEMPPMVLVVCPSPDAARDQASLSRQFGSLAKASVAEGGETIGKRSLQYVSHKCDSMVISFTPRRPEASLPPFTTWTIAYDRESPHTFQAEEHGGVVHTIPYSIRLQIVRFFEGTFNHPGGAGNAKGVLVKGWAEIPDEPYYLKYMSDRRRP